MEELQSTEVLDREILEDARKKAARILKSCEDSILAQDTDWNKKLCDAVCEINAQFEKNKKKEIEVIMARLPVDKQRQKLNKLENLLAAAVDEWYKGLSKEKIKEILLRELDKRKTYYTCSEASGTEDIKAGDKPIFNDDDKYRGKLRWRYPSLTLENNKVRILVSMEKIIKETLDENRYELIEALAGHEFLGEV